MEETERKRRKGFSFNTLLECNLSESMGTGSSFSKNKPSCVIHHPLGSYLGSPCDGYSTVISTVFMQQDKSAVKGLRPCELEGFCHHQDDMMKSSGSQKRQG